MRIQILILGLKGLTRLHTSKQGPMLDVCFSKVSILQRYLS